MRVWNEIEKGRPVVLKIFGWRRKFIHSLVSLIIEYDQHSRKGTVSRGLFFSMGWRSLFALSISGLCQHARSSGMAVAMDEKGETLEIKFARIDGVSVDKKSMGLDSIDP